jgi:hypothetical protein
VVHLHLFELQEKYDVKQTDVIVRIENISKEVVVAYFKARPQKYFDGTEEISNGKKLGNI